VENKNILNKKSGQF